MNVTEWDRAHLYRFRAYAWRPIDGDTFVALPDCGFDGSAFPHIRLLDFSAPELSKPGGADALYRLWSALVSETEEKWPLRIESKLRVRVIEDTKSFARYIATVWRVDSDGNMIDIRSLL